MATASTSEIHFQSATPVVGSPIASSSDTATILGADALAPASPVRARSKSPALRAAKAALVATYVLLAVLASLVIWQLVARGSERHVVAWSIGALFVAIALPLSLHEIHRHMLHYVSPLQRFYIRILAMVPIYSIEAWLALRFKDQTVYLNTARECYEAFVIYSFFSLLLEFLGPRERTLQLLRTKVARTGHAHAHMLFPFCCARAWKLDSEFLSRMKLCTFQYVFVRLVLSAAIFVGSFTGYYEEGAWSDFEDLYVYSVVILNVSQLVALWALVMFYHELSVELAPLSPLPKFLAIKAVVFASFWQSIIISGLAFVGVIQPTLDYTKDEVGVGLQDFLICVEMAIAAVAHRYLFSSRDFWRESGAPAPLGHEDHRPQGLVRAFMETMPADVLKDAAAIAAHPIVVVNRTLRGAGKGGDGAASEAGKEGLVAEWTGSSASR